MNQKSVTHERLDKVLSNMGYGTRTEVKKFIRDKLVMVDGIIVKDPQMKVDPITSEIYFGEERICFSEFIYLLLNKPAGYISSTYEPGKQTVVDLLPENYIHFNPFPVGRLDIDTTGLLLLTNDGAFAHQLLSPKKHVEKEYEVRTDKMPDSAVIEAFQNGVTLGDGYQCKPARLMIREDTGLLYVTITEGKFHQIKRMFAAFEIQVLALKRIRMGALVLAPSLAPGSIRELTASELSLLSASPANNNPVDSSDPF